MTHTHALAAGLAAGVSVAATLAQPVVNGALDPQYGPIQWAQTNGTGFGDNVVGANPCTPLLPGVVVALNNSNTGGVGGNAGGNLTDAQARAAAAAVATGLEFKIPLAAIGNPAGAIRIAGFVNSGGHDFVSNQFIGGTTGGGPAASGNLGEPRTLDLNTLPGAQLVTVSAGVTALGADLALDGSRDAAYGAAPLFVQDTLTGFGDAAATGPLTADGSEIDNVYAFVGEFNGVRSLYVFVGGNLQSNFNKFELFIDSQSGGQNRVRGDNPFGPLNRLGDDGNTPEPEGLVFDAGFEADYWISPTVGGDPASLFVDASQMNTNGGGRGDFLGASQAGAVTSDGRCPPPPTLPSRDIALGSEIDGLFATVCGNTLHVLVTGNLETNENRFHLFFDVAPGGQNTLRSDNVTVDRDGLNRLGGPPTATGGLTFDAGFEADYWVSFRNQTVRDNAVDVFAWAAFLRTGGAAGDVAGDQGLLDYGSFDGGLKSTHDPITFSGGFCVRRDGDDNCLPNGYGSDFNSALNGGIDVQGDLNGVVNQLPVVANLFASYAPRLISANPFNPLGFDPVGQPDNNPNLVVPGLVRITIDNSNVAGVTGAGAAGAASVTTGVELAIRLDELGWDGSSPIRVSGFIASPDNSLVSNQVVGGLPPGTPNLGEPRAVDFNAIVGNQFVTINPGTCSGNTCRADFNGDAAVNVSDIFAFLSAWFAQGPGADFNSDTAVNVSDIFAFLSAWFAGCP